MYMNALTHMYMNALTHIYMTADFPGLVLIYLMFVFIVGVLQADTGVIRDGKQIFRLFCHESMRVFHDRLINNEDKNYFYHILADMASKHFGEVNIREQLFLLLCC